MKVCGCSRCPNPYEDFERYCEEQEKVGDEEFERIFLASYSLAEMWDLYAEYGESFDIAEKIAAYTMKEN